MKSLSRKFECARCGGHNSRWARVLTSGRRVCAVCFQELPLSKDGAAMDDMKSWNVPHRQFKYICLPDGDVMGYCSDCKAYHLPGDIVSVLTPEEFLHYLELYLRGKSYEALNYLSSKPNGKHPH